MPEPFLYVKAMGAAAIVSAALVLAMARTTARTTGRTGQAGRAAWSKSGPVLAMALGLAVGFSLLSLQSSWPPANGLDRYLSLVVPAILGIELIAGCPWVSNGSAWFLRLSLAAAIPRILLHGSVYLSGSGDEWPRWRTGVALVVCGLLLAGMWGLLSWLCRRSPGVTISFALGMAILCTGLTVMMAGYIKGGAAAFPLAATLFATTMASRLVVARWNRESGGGATNHAAQAILGVGVVSLFSLLFIGRFFGRLPTGSGLALLLAPLLCWGTEIPVLRHRKPWLLGSLRMALVAIPLLVVLVVAKRDFDREMGPLLGKVPADHSAAVAFNPTPSTSAP